MAMMLKANIRQRSWITKRLVFGNSSQDKISHFFYKSHKDTGHSTHDAAYMEVSIQEIYKISKGTRLEFQ